MNKIPTRHFATWRLIAWSARTAYRIARLPYRAVVALYAECEHNKWLPFALAGIGLMIVGFPW